MKYIAKSGEPPHPKASSDGCHVSCLGLSWNTEEDTLAVGFIKDFFLKRFKKHLPPPDLNLSEPAARNEAMARNLLTRAGVLSRVAELYDPCSWWEPVKVRMKLALQQFNGLEWTAMVPPEHQEYWAKLFRLMNQVHSITIPRCALVWVRHLRWSGAPSRLLLLLPGEFKKQDCAWNHPAQRAGKSCPGCCFLFCHSTSCQYGGISPLLHGLPNSCVLGNQQSQPNGSGCGPSTGSRPSTT